MKACWCTLAGTKACDYCPNGPSRMNTSIPTPFDKPSVINIEHLTVNINSDDDPEEIKRKIKNIFKEYEEVDEKAKKIYNKTWTSSSL